MTTPRRHLSVGMLLAWLVGCSYDFSVFEGATSNASGGAAASGGDGSGAGMNAGGNIAGSPTATNSSASASSTSTGGSLCGNGQLDGQEECDDGDIDDQDGCAGCMIRCNPPYFEDPTTGHCYWIRVGDATWADARAACQVWQGGADLAVITTSEEDDLLRARVDPEDFDENMNGTFFGAGDLTLTNTWAWVNGEPWSYDDWSSNQPNNYYNGRDEDCAAYINLGGGVGWYDAPCSLMLSSVCEWAP